jgi:hypothetical protein
VGEAPYEKETLAKRFVMMLGGHSKIGAIDV